MVSKSGLPTHSQAFDDAHNDEALRISVRSSWLIIVSISIALWASIIVAFMYG